MRFQVRKRRQAPAVIIVALIDILIVLLIFLMVTTTFKQQQPSLKLALPESTQSQKSGANETAPLIVSIDSQGGLRFGPEAKPVTGDRLETELLAEIVKTPDLRLAISTTPDDRSPAQRLLNDILAGPATFQSNGSECTGNQFLKPPLDIRTKQRRRPWPPPRNVRHRGSVRSRIDLYHRAPSVLCAGRFDRPAPA